MTRTLALRLFATAREAAGRATIERATGPDGVTLRTVLRELANDTPELGPILRHARFARNGNYVRGRDVRLRAGDELAVHPPYSGG
jgi:molybdopterin converting factor small subunit